MTGEDQKIPATPFPRVACGVRLVTGSAQAALGGSSDLFADAADLVSTPMKTAPG